MAGFMFQNVAYRATVYRTGEYVQSGLFSFMIFYQSGKRKGILQKFCIFVTLIKQISKLRSSKILP